MTRMSDEDKLLMLAKKYFTKHGEFTSAMLFHYVLRQKTKFRRDMTTRRIGRILTASKKYEKVRKKCMTYYTAV